MNMNGNPKKKVAVISDVIMEFGGAEKVLDCLLKMYPESELYTLFVVPKAKERIEKNFPEVIIHTSILQVFVGDRVSKYVSWIKIFSWIYWETINLAKYDLVVSSSHSFMSKNVNVRKDAFHLSYIHTPPRYLYKEFCEIGIIRNFPWNIVIWPVIVFLRWIDYLGSKKPNVLVVNSKNVRKRVANYYGRDSIVVYPPVEVIPVKKDKPGNYYVCLSRLVKQKGIDLAVKTCTKYNLPLTVVGNGSELSHLKSISGPTVRFVENCEEREKFRILAGAKALIYTSKEEDFGIVPVEALKIGVPVVAFNSGGVKESVVNKKNGILFDRFNEESLKKALELLDKIKIEKKVCQKSSEGYSFENFKIQISSLIPA